MQRFSLLQLSVTCSTLFCFDFHWRTSFYALFFPLYYREPTAESKLKEFQHIWVQLGCCFLELCDIETVSLCQPDTRIVWVRAWATAALMSRARPPTLNRLTKHTCIRTEKADLFSVVIWGREIKRSMISTSKSPSLGFWSDDQI